MGKNALVNGSLLNKIKYAPTNIPLTSNMLQSTVIHFLWMTFLKGELFGIFLIPISHR